MNAMKKILVLCATVCLAAAVAACGSKSSDTDHRIQYRNGHRDLEPPPPKPPPPPEASSAPAEATGPASSAPAVASATITIANMSFGDPVTVAPGAEVTVKNDDTPEHSVTSDTEGAFDKDVDGGEADTFTAPTEPGEYAFHCTYHPSMKGTLIVK